MEWKEITKDNLETIYQFHKQDYSIKIAFKLYGDYYTYTNLSEVGISLENMAKSKGYYYIVLPKLY